MSQAMQAADIDVRFAKRASKQFEKLKKEFYRGGSLIRFAGNAKIADAVFEDYAQVARASFNFGRKFERDDAIDLARSLTETAHSLFLKQDRWQQKAQPLIPIAPASKAEAKDRPRSRYSAWPPHQVKTERNP